MANSASARKRARQAETRRQRNASARSRFRRFVKNVVSAIENGDKEAAQANYQKALPEIDISVSKGIIHANKAARHKSRLNARIRSM